MTSYSKEQKKQVLSRLEAPENLSISTQSNEENVPESTIYGWIKQAKKSKKQWSSEEKFHIVLETFPLNEAALGEYVRKNGLLMSDIKEWKENCCSTNGSKKSAKGKTLEESKETEKSLKEELKVCKKEMKSKEKELIRKEKALAEVIALLVLKGKAQAIWGEDEEE